MDVSQLQSVGPGTVRQEDSDAQPLLNGMSEYHFVDVFNPLPIPFTGQFAATKPVNAPMRIGKSDENGRQISERDLDAALGGAFRNPDFQGRTHVTTNYVIEAGETKRLLGNEAQVIVRQLVNALMDLDGATLRRGNNFYRRKYEEKVVKNYGEITASWQPVEDQLRASMGEPQEFAELNEVADEPKRRPPKETPTA